MTIPSTPLKPLVLLLASAFGTLALPATALAQSADGAPQRMERVIVTGSSIKRIDGETALPVQVLKREDIERTGAASTEELVKQLSSLSSAGTSTTVANASGYGGGSIATVSLRGLGGARTLVLVNGRRVSVYGGGSAGAAGSSVDVNSIPLSAIERVEVLKDGASAVYGSDAIAGVVNFILRKDFKGVEATANYGQAHDRLGKDRKASLFAGFGDFADDGWNLTASLSVQKTDAILGADRPFASRLNADERNDYTSSIAFPANVVLNNRGTLGNPALPDCGPYSLVSPFSNTRCSYDNSPFVSLQPDLEKASVMANGRLRLGGDAEAYFESGYTKNKITSTTQAVPLAYNAVTTASNPYVPAFQQLIARYPGMAARYGSNIGRGGFILVPTSPYYPSAFAAANGLTGLPLLLNYRDVANGSRNTLDVSENARLVAGVRGNLAGWDMDSALLYSQSKVHEDLLSGYAQYSKVLPIFNSGVINPFGATTDQAALDAVRAAEFRGTSYASKTSTTSIDLKGSRELWTLPAGAVGMALGAELRREEFAYDPSVAIQTGDIAGLGGNAFPVVGARNVGSVYAELSVPIIKKLDADVAVRYDSYQGVGHTVNPKASLRWQPLETLMLRSAVGKGFRAPSLTDLYTPQATSITGNGTRDYLRCPNLATGAPRDCNFQFTTITGGNPDLKPEKSLSITAGIMWEPVKNASISLDAFRIDLKDAIVVGGLSSTYFLANAERTAQYAQFINRGAPDGNAAGVGPIESIIQTNANLFKTKVAGVDVDGTYRLRIGDANRFTLRLSGTYMDKYDTQGPDGTYTSSLDQALNASGGVIVRWKHNAGVTWQNGPYAATLLHNYQKAYTDALANLAPAGTTARRDVAAYQTVDLQLAYSGFANTRLTLGVKNLADRDPPYTNLTSNFLGGYDVSYGDPRGRFVYVSATYSYK
ncbi:MULTISPECIES: TonB-dependent receptor [unclassified Massilia]|uniref:TonB-dependent receptor n=1 Tax=unclassified Massilia TaxID=2609279 RepID=UPI001780E30E|nr:MULTISPECIES: TonB-dependent receptor [unclassified Massilia]MBD8529770.1 TonB-dependent receptor [Massilia sp. CFBP 13647]MBD8672218.1 TonB-dependent receptor [Massilia sp. CFBP 13721]